jgi:methyl-accepting chemotaxis protein/methyl-accepting chemotaxis protein-1 (serine sensor receptor)
MGYKSLTIGAKTALGTGLLVTLLAVMAWFSWYTLATLHHSFEVTAGTTVRKIRLAGEMNTAEANMAAGQRGMVLFTYAKKPDRAAAAKALFHKNSEEFDRAITEIRPLLLTQRGREVVAQMQSRLSVWLPAYTELERLAEAGDPDGAARVLSEKTTVQYIALGEDCRELTMLANQVLENDRLGAQDQFSTARWLLVFLIVVGAATAAASSVILRGATLSLRQIATEMLEGSRQVFSASGQVASASQSLAQGTSEQAATLEETSSSATEITAITQKNAENTRSVAGLMTDTAHLVEGANRNLEEMVLSMNEIRGSSEKISKIIRAIDEIAFQTNILALNAAVEAARAGEAGMGFAVVADEVRNLAHRSAQAAKDTTVLIEESIARSGEGGRKLDQVASSIQQITGSSIQIKTLIDEVDVGSHEQSRGIEQISTAVNQMEQVTQRSAANSQQSAAASEELAAQAQSLHAIVERLRALVGGDGLMPVSRGVSHPGVGPSAGPKAKIAPFRGAPSHMRARPAAGPPHPASTGHASFPLDDDEGGF